MTDNIINVEEVQIRKNVEKVIVEKVTQTPKHTTKVLNVVVDKETCV